MQLTFTSSPKIYALNKWNLFFSKYIIYDITVYFPNPNHPNTPLSLNASSKKILQGGRATYHSLMRFIWMELQSSEHRTRSHLIFLWFTWNVQLLCIQEANIFDKDNWYNSLFSVRIFLKTIWNVFLIPKVGFISI